MRKKITSKGQELCRSRAGEYLFSKKKPFSSSFYISPPPSSYPTWRDQLFEPIFLDAHTQIFARDFRFPLSVSVPRVFLLPRPKANHVPYHDPDSQLSLKLSFLLASLLLSYRLCGTFPYCCK